VNFPTRHAPAWEWAAARPAGLDTAALAAFAAASAWPRRPSRAPRARPASGLRAARAAGRSQSATTRGTRPPRWPTRPARVRARSSSAPARGAVEDAGGLDAAGGARVPRRCTSVSFWGTRPRNAESPGRAPRAGADDERARTRAGRVGQRGAAPTSLRLRSPAARAARRPRRRDRHARARDGRRGQALRRRRTRQAAAVPAAARSSPHSQACAVSQSGNPRTISFHSSRRSTRARARRFAPRTGMLSAPAGTEPRQASRPPSARNSPRAGFE